MGTRITEPLADRTLLRVDEAAKRLGISRSYLWLLIQRGEIMVIRMGRVCRIPAVWLEKWVDQKVKVWEEAHGQGESQAGPFGGGR